MSIGHAGDIYCPYIESCQKARNYYTYIERYPIFGVPLLGDINDLQNCPAYQPKYEINTSIGSNSLSREFTI